MALSYRNRDGGGMSQHPARRRSPDTPTSENQVTKCLTVEFMQLKKSLEGKTLNSVKNWYERNQGLPSKARRTA
jgi:hypothetical protein